MLTFKPTYETYFEFVNPDGDLFGSEPFWRGWLEPICIGVGWISRLWSSKSASAIPNIVVAKPSRVVTEANIVIVGRCVRGRGRKGN